MTNEEIAKALSSKPYFKDSIEHEGRLYFLFENENTFGDESSCCYVCDGKIHIKQHETASDTLKRAHDDIRSSFDKSIIVELDPRNVTHISGWSIYY